MRISTREAHVFVASVCILAAVVLAPHRSQAAVTFDPNDPATNDLLKSMKRPPDQIFEERQKNVPKIAIEPEKKGVEAHPGEKVKFDTFVLQGCTILKKDDIEKVIKPFIGEEMTQEQLQRLAGILTKLYANAGYLTSYCYIPPQKMEGGRVVFQCVETRIGRLIINNAEDYNQKLFMRFIKPLLDKPLNVNELNERLKSLSLMPTFIASVEIKRTEKEEIVDLQIDLKEKPFNTAEIYGDNFGSRYSGEERIGAVYNIVNPTGYGDVLSLHARTSADTRLSHFFSLSYKRLVNDQGGILTATGNISDYEVEEEMSPPHLRNTGSNNGLTVNYKHPLYVSPQVVLTGNLQYDYKDVTSKTDITTSGGGGLFDKEDKTHVFSAGVDAEFVDRFGGWNSLGFSLQRGVEGFFDGMRKRDTIWTSPEKGDPLPIRGTIREEVVPDFTLLNVNWYRRKLLTILDRPVENILAVYGQFTWDRVPSAYTFADGDSGYHAGIETRIPIKGDSLKLTASFSHEMYFNSPKSRELVTVSSDHSESIGGGVMGYLSSLKLDYYVAYIKGLNASDGSWEGYRNLNKLSFLVSKRF
jgi:hemolysin activation/secretion protein